LRNDSAIERERDETSSQVKERRGPLLTVRDVAMADFGHGLNRVRERAADMLEV
jgi:hypothetical protein